MATRIEYIAVRLEITNPEVSEITDEEVEQVISNTDYTFKDVDSFQISTEIIGKIDIADL